MNSDRRVRRAGSENVHSVAAAIAPNTFFFFCNAIRAFWGHHWNIGVLRIEINRGAIFKKFVMSTYVLWLRISSSAKKHHVLFIFLFQPLYNVRQAVGFPKPYIDVKWWLYVCVGLFQACGGVGKADAIGYNSRTQPQDRFRCCLLSYTEKIFYKKNN